MIKLNQWYKYYGNIWYFLGQLNDGKYLSFFMATTSKSYGFQIRPFKELKNLEILTPEKEERRKNKK